MTTFHRVSHMYMYTYVHVHVDQLSVIHVQCVKNQSTCTCYMEPTVHVYKNMHYANQTWGQLQCNVIYYYYYYFKNQYNIITIT